jgi:hypothetical protein
MVVSSSMIVSATWYRKETSAPPPIGEQKLRRNRMYSMRTCDLSLVAECRDQCDQAVDKSFVFAHTGDVHQRTSRGTEAF